MDILRLIADAGYDSATAVAIGLSSPDATVFAERNDDGEGPVLDRDAVAYAASVGKQITGACAVLLATTGTLDLEAQISDLLPGLPEWAQTIRVRHLIHHTAGLPTMKRVWDQMTRSGASAWTSDGVLAALATVPALDHPPGTAYAYSNIGYICLGRIIERLSGHDLNAFAQTHLFEPLEMHQSILWSGPAPSPPVAAFRRRPPSTAALSVGDGGLWTSVSDLLRWNYGLLSDAIGVTDMLHTVGTLDDGTPLDYAWGVRVFNVGGIRIESHGGDWERATAMLVRLPDLGAGFAVLAHGGSVAQMTALSSSLQDMLLGDEVMEV